MTKKEKCPQSFLLGNQIFKANTLFLMQTQLPYTFVRPRWFKIQFTDFTSDDVGLSKFCGISVQPLTKIYMCIYIYIYIFRNNLDRIPILCIFISILYHYSWILCNINITFVSKNRPENFYSTESLSTASFLRLSFVYMSWRKYFFSNVSWQYSNLL